MKDDRITIIDEQGKEKEMKILLTFDANDRSYVVVYGEDDPDSCIPFIYDEEGNLYAVESDEEMEMIEEVVSAYEEEQ